MKLLTKIFVGILSLFTVGCDKETVVGSIDCEGSSIDVLSIKNAWKPGYEQTWSDGISYGGTTLKIRPTDYPGFLPDSFARQITGSKARPDVNSTSFPHGGALQFYMGEFSSSDRKTLTKCLIDNDTTLRSHLLKTTRMKKFKNKKFDSKFVFWEGTKKDLVLKFYVPGTKDGYLTNSNSSALFYRNESTDRLLRVGQFEWDKNAKMVHARISFGDRKDLPAETDPSKYKLDGKSIGEYFSVPIVGESAKKP